MIWSFQRKGAQTRCEVRREIDGDGFEFLVTHPNGKVDVERFDDPSALIDRSVAYLDRLRQDGWRPVPSPQAVESRS